MSNEASITSNNEYLFVSGNINFVTAVSLWSDSLPLLTYCKKLVFDFSRVTSSSSASLALMLEWIKYARRVNKSIQFQNLPSQVISIATVAGIDKLITNLH